MYKELENKSDPYILEAPFQKVLSKSITTKEF